MSADLISAVIDALKRGNVGGFSSDWDEENAESGFWINHDDYERVRAAVNSENQWKPIWQAPKDGTHILACDASRPYGQHWTFGQAPPTVVHWWANPGEEGFYTSVNELAPQRPFPATHWMHLPVEPVQK